METTEPAQDGENSIEAWDDEPVCTFDPDKGFAINQRSLGALRWYAYLSNSDEEWEVP
jgi:hypothetical protein